ncbi:hypothetical protein QOZ80_6BG0485060 [Eleusine coracana subsp. coracana]|nr:hypothetical protein QOZ80_6BG0485060 [Eleusine coracana subsp. coracana]
MGIPKEFLWDHFISERDSKACSKLVDYLKEEASTVDVRVPGCDPSNERQLKSSDLSKHLTSSALEWMTQIHFAGWSLNGKLSVDDILITPLSYLKMHKDKMNLLRKCRLKRKKKDMAAIAEVIHTSIFKGATDIPHDLRHLLWLLRHYKSRYVNLVHNHPSLQNEEKNLSTFGLLYMNLQQLSEEDQVKYSRIVSKVPYCNINKDHWKLRIQQNKYLMQLIKPNSTLSAQVQPSLATVGGTQHSTEQQTNSIGPEYSNEGDGLLDFLSDARENLVDISVGEVELKRGQKRKEKVVLFQYHQMQHMFDAAVPQGDDQSDA